MHFYIKIQLCQRECGQYAVKCHACHKICNGETGRRLGDRFREHLRSTRLPDSDLPVGGHFASSGHTNQDMLVSDERSFEAMVVSMWTVLSNFILILNCYLQNDRIQLNINNSSFIPI